MDNTSIPRFYQKINKANKRPLYKTHPSAYKNVNYLFYLVYYYSDTYIVVLKTLFGGYLRSAEREEQHETF